MHDATAIRHEGDRLHVALSDGGEVSAHAVILATGATYRRLGVPEVEALVGAGVFYGGSASEAPTTVDEEVYVVGGANSAGQAALHLAEFAHRVTLMVRAESLDKGMSHYLARQVEGTPNLDVRLGTEVVGGGGGGDGGFIRTGTDLESDGDWPLEERNPFSLETSMPGVFAAGDARQGSMNRVASAVGEGSIAIRLVHELFEAEQLHSRDLV